MPNSLHSLPWTALCRKTGVILQGAWVWGGGGSLLAKCTVTWRSAFEVYGSATSQFFQDFNSNLAYQEPKDRLTSEFVETIDLIKKLRKIQ